jgi:single-stranded-DNA-specific exonuclease
LNELKKMNERIWLIPEVRPEAEALARELGLPPALARVLSNRGICDPGEGRRFLYGTIDDLSDPFLLSGMAAAVRRIRQAVERREKILVFGDYDVDGVLSVVMLLKAFHDLGVEADYFIPDRIRDGYGLKAVHVDIVREKKAGLVISVDCGIKAHDFVEKAGEMGVDVVITDHHLPGPALPRAAAILNPVLPDSGYPDKNLAGVGVVFKLLEALLKGHPQRAKLGHYLKLVSVGTIADVAELRGENRLFVKYGLAALADAVNPGLKSLLEICGLKGQKVSEGDVAFRIGPRLNAAGRMESADQAVRLFLTDSAAEARDIVQHLDELNSRRQNAEEKIFHQALEKIQSQALDQKHKLLILGSEEWHRGILGIVASRLKEAFHRPVILFSYENGLAHGSGRSIREFSLIECLDACRASFLNYGGHRLAVGCSLMRDRMSAFKDEVNAYTEGQLSEEDLKPKVRVDTTLDPDEITDEFLGGYSLLEPFGVGNPTPVFMAADVQVASAPQKLQGRHAKFLVRKAGRTMEAIGWDKGGWADSLTAGDKLSLAYSLQFSTYLGATRPYLNLEDIRS